MAGTRRGSVTLPPRYDTAQFPANTRRWANGGLRLAQRRRRWANLKQTLVKCPAFPGKWTGEHGSRAPRDQLRLCSVPWKDGGGVFRQREASVDIILYGLGQPGSDKTNQDSTTPWCVPWGGAAAGCSSSTSASSSHKWKERVGALAVSVYPQLILPDKVIYLIYLDSQVKIQFNSPKIATKGFSTDSSRD